MRVKGQGLILSGGYISISCALSENGQTTVTQTEKSGRASADLIPIIDNVFNRSGSDISQIDYIAVDSGPGAFTSLRVLLTVINGISFAHKIPIVELDGLEMLAKYAHQEFSNKSQQNAMYISLLNAYNSEVYYAIYALTEDKSLRKLTESSYKNIQDFLTLLQDIIAGERDKKQVIFSGNGAELYHEEIVQALSGLAGTHEIIFNNPAEYPVAPIDILVAEGFQKYSEALESGEKFSYKVMPRYLKTQKFAQNKNI